MDTLEIKKEAAVQAHENAKSSGRKLLEDLFGKKTFQKDVMERIKTFEDALDELGINPDHFNNTMSSFLSPDEVAYRKLKVIVKAFNEGWKPNFGNFDEAKYYPWFTFQKGSERSSGFGFSYNDWTHSTSNANVGSRLCFRTAELAEYAGKQFEELYRDYLV